MIVTIYNTSTGVIRAVVDTQDLSTVLLNIGPGDAVIEGRIDPATHYVTPAGPVAYPTRPGEWAVWNGHRWTDPRGMAQLVAELEAMRARASLPKGQLLFGLMEIGIISADDAKLSARDNTIPVPFAALIDSWPAADRLREEITWAAEAQINRNQAVIAAAVAELDLDPVALDRLFGIV